jgi:hypothetical protein
MAEIKDYDAVAANNTSTPPAGAPEGQAPSTVNDVIREMMARLKRAFFDSMTINTTTAATGSPKLDVVADANADAICMSDNVTNATVKDGFITCRHYTNAEETFAVISGRSNASDNFIYYGGNFADNRNCATTHIFQTAANNTTLVGTERVRLNSAGQFLIGSSSAEVIGAGGGTPQLQLHSSGASSASAFSLANWGASSLGKPVIRFLKSKSGTIGTPGKVAADDSLGEIQWFGDDGVDAQTSSGSIAVEVEGTVNTGDVQTRMIFKTADGGADTEAMRIDFTRNVLIGTDTASTGPPKLDIIGTTNDGVICIANTATDATNKSGTIVGRSYTNSHEPIQIIGHSVSSTVSTVRVGGGIGGVLNGCTEIEFFTGPYNTVTGTERASIDTDGNVVIGTAAIARASSDGFLYIPTMNGFPTGTPTAKTGLAPIVIDDSGGAFALYAYDASAAAWKGVSLT